MSAPASFIDLEFSTAPQYVTVRFWICEREPQNSLTGDPLRLFTEKFREAILRKPEGPTFYMDIVSALRDAFMGDEDQTPHFVAQLNGKEQFIDDAKKLDALRKSLEAAREATAPRPLSPAPIAIAPRTAPGAEAKVVTPKIMATLVGKFFDDLNARIFSDEFSEFFDLERVEHSDFEEPTAEQFIIRVLSKEKRADNFVTASYERNFESLTHFTAPPLGTS